MSDLSAYRDKAANFGKLANQAEQDKDYAGAFEFYMKALDIFQHMIKCKFKLIRSYKRLLCWCWRTNSNQISYKLTIDEKNPKLKEIYQRKAEEYFERAAYLKK